MVRNQSLHNFCAWLMVKDKGNITITDVDEDALEAQCTAIEANRCTGSKTDSDKVYDKYTIWDGDIFKLGIVLKNFNS